MATALSPSRPGPGTCDPQLARLFGREIAPHLPALEAERAQGRSRFITMAVGFGAGAMVLLMVLWPLDRVWAIVGTAIALVIGLHMLGRQQRRFRHRVRDLVMPAICRAIGDLRHSAGSAPGIPFDDLESMGLLPRHNRRQVDDVFEGRYRDTGFVMAEARLRYRSGGSKSRTRTVFRGLIFAIEVPRNVPARILVAREAGAIGNRLKGWMKGFSGLERVSLPHPAFEARFEVYSDDPAVARDTVGPAFCDAMVALAEAHDGQAIQGGFRLRWFYLTIPSKRRDQFRLGSLFRPLDSLEEDAQRVLQDVRIVHRVIDTLHGDRP
jgi:Protein of unknown function (DUF3137)